MSSAKNASVARVNSLRVAAVMPCPVICMKPTVLAASSTCRTTSDRAAASAYGMRKLEMSITGTARTPSRRAAEDTGSFSLLTLSVTGSGVAGHDSSQYEQLA